MLKLTDSQKLIFNLIGFSIRNNSFEFESIMQNSTNLDWNYISNFTKRHGLASILYLAIKDKEPNNIMPLEILSDLKNFYYLSLSENINRIENFKKIKSCYNEKGIELYPLKGIYLLTEIYDNPAYRPMSDIDILIDRKKLNIAIECLEKLGYIRIPIRSKIEDKYFLNYNLQYFHKSSFLELHIALFPPYNNFNINIKPLINNNIINENKIEFFIIHKCLHLYYNINNKSIRFSWFYDLIHVIELKKDSIDWSVIERIIKENNVHYQFSIIINIIKKHYDINIPFESKYFMPKSDYFEDYLLENMTNSDTKNYSLFEKIKLIKSTTDIIVYTFNVIIPPKSYLKFKKTNLFNYWKSLIK